MTTPTQEIMKLATDISYRAENEKNGDAALCSITGAYYIALAIQDERERCMNEFEGAAESGIGANIDAERERCAKLVEAKAEACLAWAAHRAEVPLYSPQDMSERMAEELKELAEQIRSGDA